MNRTLATARRVATQLRHDPRSLALLLAVPSLLMALFKYVFDGEPAVFDRIGPQFLGIFPFILMFLLTSVTMVRERTSGTLERLFTTPLGRGELIAGYALALGAAALLQAAVTTAVAVWVLDLELTAPGIALVIAMLNALLGTTLGLLTSAFATTEFQAVQFMPLIVIPQILLCGLLIPRENMADMLTWISHALPLSYTSEAFEHLAGVSGWDGELWAYTAALTGFVLFGVVGASLTLRRVTP